MDLGDKVVCTITNTFVVQKITIIKFVPNGDAQDFNFTSNFTGHLTFVLDDDEGVEDVPDNATNSNTENMTNVTPGLYNVAEPITGSAAEFWQLTNIECEVFKLDENGDRIEGATSSTWMKSLITADVEIDLKDSEEVECTFTNETGFPTRTQGFYRSHTDVTRNIFVFPNATGEVVGFTNGTIILGSSTTGIVIDNIKEVFGLYYASNHFNNEASMSKSDDTPRTPWEQAFIIMAHQLMTAKINCAVFGCPASIELLITQCDDAFGLNDTDSFNQCNADLDDYNNSGENGEVNFQEQFGIPPGASPQESRMLAKMLLQENDTHSENPPPGPNTGISKWDNPIATDDFDFDGIPNLVDNCPIRNNTGQEDTIGGANGIGDACEDFDGDGLLTYDEINLFGTDPLVADTDGGGEDDGHEVAFGRDPTDIDDDVT